MALKNCIIVFNHRPDGVFYAGETVTGSIHLTMEKKKSCDALTLKISGESNVRFHEHKGTGKNRRTVHFSGNDIYFKTLSDLTQGYSTELDCGLHSFNFTFTLPASLPSSFEGRYGCVRYRAKVTMNRKMKFDLCYRVSFTVLSNGNLNLFPILQMPANRVVSEEFYFLFSKKGRLTLTIDIPCTGFVPGQDIHLKCYAKNDGKVKITDIKFSLVKTITFLATYPYHNSRTDTLKVAQCSGGGVETNEQKLIMMSLRVPPLPPSSEIIRSIITVQYVVRVRAVVSGMHIDPKCTIPVTIGTHPFYNTSVPQPTTSMQSSAPPPYADIAPPTYEEVIVEKRMEEEREGWDHAPAFSPRYPVFNFNHNQPNQNK